MIRRLEITPAFDKRHPSPSKNCGVGDCYLRFYLGNDLGYVQFIVSTGWYLPHIVEEQLSKPDSPIAINRRPWTFLRAPAAVDLGYHSPVSKYDGQTEHECHLLPGGKCYYDGSTLSAVRVLDILYHKGSDGVWQELENLYRELFVPVRVNS